MKVLGIIAEYNPFHNGHKFHLKKSMLITGATHVIAVMSGNFLQRGEPALLDKWTRAEIAIKEGIDLIIELPTIYACNSAEFFAKGSISLLNALNVVDFISFGSENGEIDKLNIVANLLANEPDKFKNILKSYLDTGIVFPKARQKAIQKFLESSYDLNSILSNPNNILGIEYLKALKQINSNITPVTIKRIKADYNATEINGNICSATAIRKLLLKNPDNINALKNVLPQNSFDILYNNILDGKGPNFIQDLEQIILFTLRTIPKEKLKYIHDVNEGLENRLKKAAINSNNFNILIQNIKTKRYALTRIQRILMKTLINITKSDIELFKDNFTPKYLRILGFSKKGAELLRVIKEVSEVPIITNLNQYVPQDLQASRILEIDTTASDIYSLLYKNISIRRGGYDYLRKPYINL